MKISFINAIANIAERVGGNIDQIKEGLGSDRRIGMEFLIGRNRLWRLLLSQRSAGFSENPRDAGYHFELLDSVTRINQDQRDQFYTRFTTFSGR
jgi:UDPglucose 6-dehydrogenase